MLNLFLEMKADLLVALKNQHDPRRYGLLLPIREWLPGLNEENLLSLLGKKSLKNLIKDQFHIFRYNKSSEINSLCR
jgi:hypothetical protein